MGLGREYRISKELELVKRSSRPRGRSPTTRAAGGAARADQMSEKVGLLSPMLTRPVTLLATVARPCTAQNATFLPAHLARYAHSESLVVGDRQPLSSPIVAPPAVLRGQLRPRLASMSTVLSTSRATRSLPFPPSTKMQNTIPTSSGQSTHHLAIFPADSTFAAVYSHDQRRIFLRSQGGEAQR